MLGRSPHGERGLKCGSVGRAGEDAGRSPHGERGLKLLEDPGLVRVRLVALLMESVD